MKSVFVTATDTSVGKTFVCGLLLKFLREKGFDAGYQKWASTGGEDPPDDLVHCYQAAGLDYDASLLDLQVPYRFRFPASPHLAAELEKREIDPVLIIDRYNELKEQCEILVVEGVGGLLVPLRRDLLLADLLAQLKLPTLVVARSGLGTINHTLLSLEALRKRDIPILGVVFSDSVENEEELLVQDNMRTVAEVGQVVVFGRIPRCRIMVDAGKAFEGIAESILRSMNE